MLQNKLPLRIGVGVVVINDENMVFVGKRKDNPKNNRWQMPQGGIDENENPEEAVWREMMEEIGTNKAKLITSSSQWINYDIPKETLATLPWGKNYVGQTQKWFIVRFIGNDKEINLKTKKPEFIEWRWISHKLLTEVIVDFKKNVYKKLEVEISDFIN